jgi:hypothetical protein
MLRRAASLWLWAGMTACAAVPAGASTGLSARGTPAVTSTTTAAPASAIQAAPRALHYTFSLDVAFKSLSARLCFAGAAPPLLVCGMPKSANLMRDPRVVFERGTELVRPLARERDQIRLDGLAADSCIAFEIDVQAALENDSLMLAYPGEHSLLVGAELFLWRPAKRAADLAVSARFELPEGMQVSAPWPEQAGSYRLDESAFAFTGHLVFGHFARQPVAVPGGALDLIVMDGFDEPARSLIAPWLASAGVMVAQPSGAFPAPHAQVIVVPTSPSTFPIHFGHTGRSGGGSIVLFMPTDMDREQFRSDWIAVHEFSHLLHPFVQRGDAWLSEGLATYLQEVLRVRAGMLPPEQAWRRLYEGALLGRETEQSLAQETRMMAYAGNYQRVYWAGAAIALMADVELRRKTDGKASLDAVLAGLTRDHVGALRGLSAGELLREMDARAGMPVFQDIASRYLAGGRLPDLSALYRELGLLDASDRLGSPRAAPLAWVRDAIMAPHDVALPLLRTPG